MRSRFFHPQNREVTNKLLAYSGLMVGFPISTFYFSYYVLFKGNQDMLGWSGLLAVLAANMVIVAYVIMAWREDEQDRLEEAQRKAKTSPDSQTLSTQDKPKVL